jgi:choline dehydrogenase-like flavoprotein
MALENQVTYALDDEVDFVVIGSGSAGGIIARELSTNGFKVVVLEQGPFRTKEDFTHDALNVFLFEGLQGGGNRNNQQTFRSDASETAEVPQRMPAFYAHGVGGSSVHFTANFWRLREVDFKERSLLGPISGTNFADWPIDYAELEPYYARVDWEIGVAGAPGPSDSFRSRPFPMKPLPIKSSGVLMERGAEKLGYECQVEPIAILTEALNGRAPCINCGFCMGFGCEVGAKSSTLEAMIPAALASGNCEMRAECAVYEIATNSEGRVTEVGYIDPDGNERAQKAKAVIVSANGAETPRLLLNSANDQFPDGLANSSGFVGRNLMFNSHANVRMLFERQLNDYKGPQVSRMIHHFYETDESRGFYGGGGIDARPFMAAVPLLFSLAGARHGGPTWGAEFKANLENDFTRTMFFFCGGTSLAQDQYGRPSLRVTYKDHEDDVALAHFLQDRAYEVGEASGATETWKEPISPQTGGPHLLGTCRMGDDPETSVVDKYHRSHEIPNLFICDGSSMVTSGRGQPTMTIMALAFRASEHIMAAARNNQI